MDRSRCLWPVPNAVFLRSNVNAEQPLPWSYTRLTGVQGKQSLARIVQNSLPIQPFCAGRTPEQWCQSILEGQNNCKKRQASLEKYFGPELRCLTP